LCNQSANRIETWHRAADLSESPRSEVRQEYTGRLTTAAEPAAIDRMATR